MDRKHAAKKSRAATSTKRGLQERRYGGGFNMQDVQRTGYLHGQDMCTLMLGLGSTGSGIVDEVAGTLRREFGRLPGSFDYMTIDCADCKHVSDGTKHHHLQTRLNGAGTDPKVGERAFLKDYSALHYALDQMVLSLSPDPAMNVRVPPKEAITIVLVAGNGGSSGGMQQPAIMLCHDVLRQRRVQKPRVNLVFLGPDMPMQDANRRVTSEQRETINQTATCNIVKVAADHMKPGMVTETPPGRPAFSIAASRRVWGLPMFDQSNGRYHCGTTEQFIGMVARCLYVSTFTHCTESVENRVCDLDMLSIIGRGLRQDVN